MQTALKNNSVSTSVSVLMINAQGIMLSVLGHDYFLSYNRIPWMQDAPIRSVLNVQMSGPEAIEWPDLDVDLEIDSLRHRALSTCYQAECIGFRRCVIFNVKIVMSG